MKKLIISAIIIVSLLVTVGTVFAVKPAGNLAGAVKVLWNLSGEVMPSPPWGLSDILGSDTASKLIVNQPNGNTEVAITGAMNGLHPDTTYTVYLSNTYEPYVYMGWDITGDWALRLHYGNSTFDHDVVIDDVHLDGSFEGTGGYPAGGEPYSYPYNEIIAGTIDVTTEAVTIHSVYENGYWYEATGTIASDGTMSGTWSGSGQPGPYTWESIQGHATKTHTGSTGWSGLFTNTVQPFTFMTNTYGAGSWHLNLKDADFFGPDTYNLSVWINESGGTMLISDSFTVTVD